MKICKLRSQKSFITLGPDVPDALRKYDGNAGEKLLNHRFVRNVFEQNGRKTKSQNGGSLLSGGSRSRNGLAHVLEGLCHKTVFLRHWRSSRLHKPILYILASKTLKHHAVQADLGQGILTEGKHLYSWSPCTNLFRSAPFYIENIIYIFNKISYLNEKVNRAEPPPPLRSSRLSLMRFLS